MTPGPAASIDTGRVARLADEPVGWQHKAVPPQLWGATVTETVAARPRLSDLPTPVLTVSRPAMDANIATVARWAAERGLDLAPHGKTTMAPAVWAAQLAAGAWAVTVATPSQLAVARAFGVTRVMLANEVASAAVVGRLADGLAADPSAQVLVWVDSVEGVAMMHEALLARAARHGDTPRPLDVLVERGAPGGRSGARSQAEALAVAGAVARAGLLRLAGVAGYEGAVAHGTDAGSLDAVRGFLRDLVELHEAIGALGLYPPDLVPVVTAGGSAYTDLVADELAASARGGARVVLRPGAYVTHDDGFYRHVSPWGEHSRTTGRLVPALHAWLGVLSRPEPGLALLDGGKRDLPYDEGLPEPQLRCAQGPDRPGVRLDGASVGALNDQHAFLRLSAGAPELRVGDRVRLGLSHPCTAFDKWALIPVIDDPDAEEPLVVDLLRTFF